ncbi:TlpA family protein disulfide reductase [Niabella sp. CJ426]|uniref:TlpA family protein disulfide reductase n=1 Tax=Niabella sp. CJ426 TaxID=3393740 RepID=UPI003D04ADFA
MKLLLMFGMLWGGLYLASRKAPQPTVNDLAPTFFETEDTVPAKQQYNLVKPSQSALIYNGGANIIKPLAVGDIVPDLTFANLINDPGKSAKLSDFKGKVVILDFWATWCTSCIASFPKVQELQSRFTNDLKVLLVATPQNGDTEEKITAFHSKLAKLNRPNKLPVTLDSTLPKLFPHNAIPHYVWISKTGKVIAITGAEALTDNNIKLAIETENVNAAIKADFDKKNLYYLDSKAPLDKLSYYNILLKGRMTNLNGGGGFEYVRKTQGAITGYLFANLSLYYLYARLATRLVDDFDNDFARIITDSTDRAYLECPAGLTDDQQIAWYENYGYTLDIYHPLSSIKQLFQTALQSLNSGTDFNATIEIKETKCLILQRGNTSKQISPIAQQPTNLDGLKMINLSDVKSVIRNLLRYSLPLVDKSGIKPIQVLAKGPHPKTMNEVNQILAENNLILTEAYLQIPVMTISRKPKP